MLIAAALLPAGAPHDVLLVVTLLLLPLTFTLTRMRAAGEPAHLETLELSLVLLRAPPARSIQR